MSRFSFRECGVALIVNEEDEGSLSREEMGEQNLIVLRAALSRAIRKVKWEKFIEEDVKLLFSNRERAAYRIRVTFKKSSDLSIWKYYMKTEIIEDNKEKPIALRDYQVAIRLSEIKVTSGLRVAYGYEGHKLGIALLCASNEVVERFLKIVKKDEIDGKIVEMELEDGARAQDNEHFNRGGWTTSIAKKMGFDKKEPKSNLLYRRYN